ncbi:hypothetical protein AQUCO_00100458v1 [Aquilegia coerulea]|uniref:MADS-box domain-containing protein n=1 Tax=Aquilegia coerulea TaxID=218851 RepID=A0A2G5FAP9_AQUCA|nr:hypothetical protein AQUCO_00100458v1 [Aquilegia coerulea]
MSSGKKTAGRKKIAIEKIMVPKSLHVTFSKRSNGIFKKATELATLCGAHPFVLIFSPGGNPHLFVHPSVKTIVNRFLTNGGQVENQNVADYDDYKSACIDGLAHRYNELKDQVEAAEKKRDEKKNDNVKSPQYSLITSKFGKLDYSKIGNLNNIFEQAKHNAENQFPMFFKPLSSIYIANNQPIGYSDALALEVANQPGELMELTMQAPDLHDIIDQQVPICRTDPGSSLFASWTSNMDLNQDNFGNPLNLPMGSISSNMVPVPNHYEYINPGGFVEPMVPYESIRSTELVMEPQSSLMGRSRYLSVHKVTQFNEFVRTPLPVVSPSHDGIVHPSTPISRATTHVAALNEAIMPSPGFDVSNHFYGSEEDDVGRFYQEPIARMNQS